jgi:hypothetical protein
MELGLHAMEIIHGVERSCAENIVYALRSCPARPEPLAPGFIGGAAEKAFGLG